MACMSKLLLPLLALAILPMSAQTAAPAATPTSAVAAAPTHITPGSKLFIEPMDGFDTYLSAAILKKKVPVTIVDNKDHAYYILSGSSHYDKASWAKTIFVSPAPQVEASIAVKDAKTGALAFAYNVDKSSAVHGNQSSAEACAKHLKQAIESK